MPLLRIVLSIVLALVDVHTAPLDSAAAAPSTQVREEFFALELAASTDPARPAPPRAVGTAICRWGAGPDGGEAEWELRFDGDDTRVQHVERSGSGTAKLVWREWRPGGGRTLLAEWKQGALEVVEWGRQTSTRLSLAAPVRAQFPLELLGCARRGELSTGACAVFDPLSRAIEQVHIEVVFSGASEALGEPGEFALWRQVELRRADGSCAGSYRFRGDVLESFRWQNGALVARRISAEEHARRTAERSAPPVATLDAR